MQPLQICIGNIIRIGRESWCLPYAGFFYWKKTFCSFFLRNIKSLGKLQTVTEFIENHQYGVLLSFKLSVILLAMKLKWLVILLMSLATVEPVLFWSKDLFFNYIVKKWTERGATEPCSFLFMQGNVMELEEHNYLYKWPLSTKRATFNVLHSLQPLNKTGRHDSQS